MLRLTPLSSGERESYSLSADCFGQLDEAVGKLRAELAGRENVTLIVERPVLYHGRFHTTVIVEAQSEG